MCISHNGSGPPLYLTMDCDVPAATSCALTGSVEPILTHSASKRANLSPRIVSCVELSKTACVGEML